MELQRAADAPVLVEVRRTGERRSALEVRHRRRNPFELELCEKVSVITEPVPELVTHAGLAAAHRHAAAERDVSEVERVGQRQMREPRAVREFPREDRARVVHERATRERADVRPNLRVEPSGERPLGHVERPPHRLGPIVRRTGVVEPVVGRMEPEWFLERKVDRHSAGWRATRFAASSARVLATCRGGP